MLCSDLGQGDEVSLSKWQAVQLESLEVGRDTQTVSESLTQFKGRLLGVEGWNPPSRSVPVPTV